MSKLEGKTVEKQPPKKGEGNVEYYKAYEHSQNGMMCSQKERDKRILKEIMAGNFPNCMNNINLHIQDAP